MSDTIIKPLTAWPPTVEFVAADGLPGYRVSAHVLTPERARSADKCVELVRATLFVGCAYALWQGFSPAQFGVQLTLALAVFFTGNALALRYIPGRFRKTTLVEMTADRVGIRYGKRWQWFTRQVEHRYIAPRHDQAVWEERRNDVMRQSASIDRKVASPSFYFADSFHVALELAGHRYVLLTVYGPQEAQAVLARLQYVDRLLDGAIKRGKGVPEHGAYEWHDTPGDVA